MMTETIKHTLTALEHNGMTPYYCDTKEEVLPLVRSLLHKGDIVAAGGSVTLGQCGVIDELRNGDYCFIDRYREGLTRAQVEECFRQAFSADAFLCSSNAVTEKGELVNVDGNANRVAAILYGPTSVIIVAGSNKIVPTVEDGFRRVREVAAPKNSVRLSCDTYCAEFGRCAALDGEMDGFTAGCRKSGRICSSYTVCGPQQKKGRIKVILCGETLGY